MKAVILGALLVLAVATCSAEGSGLRRLAGTTASPVGRTAAEGARTMKAGRPLEATVDLKAVPTGRMDRTERINESCYRVARNDYCDYGEQQQCCKSEDWTHFNACQDWSNLYNCPSNRPVMVCCS